MTSEKLLIIHADDLGISESVNRANFFAFEDRRISSASIMAPTPWFSQAVNYFRANSKFDVGIHLTLTCEWKNCRWGPLAPPKLVPSLIDKDGFFWSSTKAMWDNARPKEIELEINAQIKRVLDMGVKPSHLDCHMYSLFKASFYEVYKKAAKKFRLPFLRAEHRKLSISYKHLSKSWKTVYVDFANSIQPGITHLIVHPGYNNIELAAVCDQTMAWGAKWRQKDLDVLGHPEFKKALRQNKVKIINWKHPQLKAAP